jgi:hypothetical protein
MILSLVMLKLILITLAISSVVIVVLNLVAVGTMKPKEWVLMLPVLRTTAWIILPGIGALFLPESITLM